MNISDYVSHKANLRIHLIGDSVTELFQTGLEGMNEILSPGECQKNDALTITRKLDIRSTCLESLLVDFLAEVLSLSHTQRAVFCEFKLDELTNNHCAGSVLGRKVDSFKEDIKAVTYDETEILPTVAGHLETIILFDI